MASSTTVRGRLVAALVGQLDELVILTGLVLVTCGLWAVVGRAALIAPGVVLLWIGLPTRRRFVEAPPVVLAKTERAS